MHFSLHRDDWSLHRRGQLDQQRHQEKVKEVIRQNLADIVAEESIITTDGKKVVKVPIRSLTEYRLRYDFNQGKHAGQGRGNSQVGDVIAREPAQGDGPSKGHGAGDQPGADYYEAEITVDELGQMLFADLGLPHLEPKQRRDQITTESYRFNDLRKAGIFGNVDKKRTLLETLKRNALRGRPSFSGVMPADLRFRTWETQRLPRTSAVVLAMMDTSGSMGTFEKYVARSFFFWAVRFLRTRYQDVEIVFLAHDTQAREVSEEDFFKKGESGGTRCSSVYRLALEIIEQRYPAGEYNLYPFHFTDGDNLPSDNAECVRLVNELLQVCSQVGYGEISQSTGEGGSLWHRYQEIDHPLFARARIRSQEDLYPTLRQFFRPTEVA